jgi:hypothetical protein
MYRGRSGKEAVTGYIVLFSKGDGPIRVCERAGKMACLFVCSITVFSVKVFIYPTDADEIALK